MTVVTIDGGQGQLSVGGMDIEIAPIVVPSGWSGEKDVQYLEDVFGDEWEASGLSPADFLLQILSDAQTETYLVVEHASAFLLGKLPVQMTQRVPANLSGPRFQLLRRLVQVVPADGELDTPAESVGHVLDALCFYQAELDRVLAPLVVNKTPPWLRLLQELRESLTCCADSLDDVMRCSYSEYKPIR